VACDTGAMRFAVIDLETTGIDPVSSRVIECAIVRLDDRGGVIDEWCSLLDIAPDAVTASEVHGLGPSALAGMPRFAEVIGEISARLRGLVVVGHVVRFDVQHLAAEFARAGATLPGLEEAALCTRELAIASGVERPHTLLGCCSAFGVAHRAPHSALGDARATAGILRVAISSAPLEGLADLARRAALLSWEVGAAR
jgi:DNA polymerase III epsilon subunit-like protein